MGMHPKRNQMIVFESLWRTFNSLGVFTKGTKINSLNKLCRKYNTNVLEGCKTQADWHQATDEQQFRNLIGVGMENRSVVTYNVNKCMHRNQHGGCAMMAIGRFSSEVSETSVDPYKLRRWCWMKVGSGDKSTWIVMAYQPFGSKSYVSAGTTVWEQHVGYFEARGNLRPARTIFFEQLIPQLVIWKQTDLDIILLGNVNENVYSGRIAKWLSLPDILFTKQCLQCTGLHIPPTFRDSTVPIDAVFATFGIECVNAYVLPHKGGIGNHQCFILGFTSSSIIGSKFPNIVRCSAQKLHCKLTRLVNAYNAELNSLCNHHKMYQRIYFRFLLRCSCYAYDE